MTSVTLKVGGRYYGGWKTARVMRSIDAISGAFTLGVSERWANQDELWPINEGDSCEVLLGSAPLITGTIDTRRVSYDANEHTIEVSGRDAAGALVDCSVYLERPGVKPAWEFKQIDVLTFAKKICAQFSVQVSLQAGQVVSPIAKLSIDPGDTAFNAIESACRLVGLLPISDGRGGVVLTQSGASRCTTALEEGKNILSASAEYNHASKFHRYVVLGQRRGGDPEYGETVAAVKGEATDETVSRTERVLVVRPEGNVTAASAAKRAQWEASVRSARASTVTVTVQGWTQESGALWPINSTVQIKSPLLGVDGSMLITQVTNTLSVTEGSKTELVLKGPRSYLPEDVITHESNDGRWREIARGV